MAVPAPSPIAGVSCLFLRGCHALPEGVSTDMSATRCSRGTDCMDGTQAIDRLALQYACEMRDRSRIAQRYGKSYSVGRQS